MKTRISFSTLKVFLFLLIFPLIFCVLLSAPAGAGEKESEAVTPEEVSKEISEAYAAMKNYGFTKKEEFLRWAEERNEALQTQIDVLDQQMERSSKQMQEKLKETRKELREERLRLEAKMKAVRESGEQAWEDAKWGVSAALEKLERAFEQAKSRFEQGEGEQMQPHSSK